MIKKEILKMSKPFEVTIIIKGDFSGKIINLEKLLSVYSPEVLYNIGNTLISSAIDDVEKASNPSWPICLYSLCTRPAEPNKRFCSIHKDKDVTR